MAVMMMMMSGSNVSLSFLISASDGRAHVEEQRSCESLQQHNVTDIHRGRLMIQTGLSWVSDCPAWCLMGYFMVRLGYWCSNPGYLQPTLDMC